MSNTIAILVTLDTKDQEAAYLKSEIEKGQDKALIIDIGIIGAPGIQADISRSEVVQRGGGDLTELLREPTREKANPLVVGGCIQILSELIASGDVHAVIGLGGTQGTSTCCDVMQALPYGFPKIMVSTIAAGDMTNFVGIKDITMMFSVSDILKLNVFTRKILANAAAAACGMANVQTQFTLSKGDKPLIGMSNLGVLTRGAMEAIEYIQSKGYEVIVFHAIGAPGRAMEQMMKEGIIGAVFDYAMGEIADDVWGVLRSGGPERLTVAGKLGIPQVLCPGGAEHLGILVNEPNSIPEEYKDHQMVFHSPVIFVPRLNESEMIRVADEICSRLQHTHEKSYFMFPLQGVSRYSRPGGVLEDKAADEAFLIRLKDKLPSAIELITIDANAEDDPFVHACVDRLIELIEAKNN